MPTRSLPLRPNLDQLKIQGNDLRRRHRQGSKSAAARIAAHHPKASGRSIASILAKPLSLADAQLVIAREYGFEGWPRLKHHVEYAQGLAGSGPIRGSLTRSLRSTPATLNGSGVCSRNTRASY
jgi:hypothetical protein